MNRTESNIIKQILWPPKNPILISDATKESQDRWWKIQCALTVIPFTAIFHHAIFYRPTCMLNPFGEAYYIPSVLFTWLSRDPSLPWAIVLTSAIFYVGKKIPSIKLLIAPLFICFLPLSLWIWDIPFTNRLICDHFHDNKLIFFKKYPVKSKYFYFFGTALYVIFLIYLKKRDNLLKEKNDQS